MDPKGHRSAQYYFELGIRELDAGNIHKAIRVLKLAIHANPHDPRPYINLGIAYELSREYEKAREVYEKALKINPQNHSALNSLAGLALRDGNPQEAYLLYDSAISSNPLYVEPYLNLARMFMEACEFTSAEVYIRKVLVIEPNNTEALNFLGIITNSTNRHEEAVEHFQEALRYDANQSSILSNLGTALRNINDKKRAVIAFEKASELSPENVTVINNLGVLYHEIGEYEKAEVLFQRAIELQPENPFPFYNSAELFIARGDYRKALENLKQYIALVPLDLDTLFKTCGIARMANQLTDVVEEMKSFIRESNPTDTRVGIVTIWLKRAEENIPLNEESEKIKPQQD